MIDFNKYADLIENTLQNVYITYSEFDSVLSVRLKDDKLNLTLDAAPEVIEKLESYYKRYFVANENGDGTHKFSKNYKTHRKFVRDYVDKLNNK